MSNAPKRKRSPSGVLDLVRLTAARVLHGLAADHADRLAVEITDYARRHGGGLFFRLRKWQPRAANHDLFPDADPPRPTQPPRPQYTSPTSQNHDFILFLQDTATWILAGSLPSLPMRQIAAAAAAIADGFHEAAAGRDMCYFPKGVDIDLQREYDLIWDEFNGRNFDVLAQRYGRSEMRIRQIVKERRRSDKRQRHLF